MFTGIIKATGRVVTAWSPAAPTRLTLETSQLGAWRTQVDDSLAVNGVCLTAIAVTGSQVTVEVMPETLSRTTLGGLRAGDRVNLEPALRLSDRLDGHVVQGHVDTTVPLLRRVGDGNAQRLTLRLPSEPALIVSKGAVALDGVSLTVSAIGPTTFEVSLIPHTLARTVLGDRQCGQVLNLEYDILGKYGVRQREVQRDDND